MNYKNDKKKHETKKYALIDQKGLTGMYIYEFKARDMSPKFRLRLCVKNWQMSNSFSTIYFSEKVVAG